MGRRVTRSKNKLEPRNRPIHVQHDLDLRTSMTTTTVADLLYLPPTDALRFLPEGPTALGKARFSWVAIQHGAQALIGSLNIFDLATASNVSHDLPGRPGFAKPTSNPNKFVVGCERALGLYDISDHSWQELAAGVDHDVEGTIINDGTLFADNVVFGTKDLAFATPKAALYAYRGSDKQLVKLAGGQICSNGKDVVCTANGKLKLIDIDSPTRKIVQYQLDLKSGSLTDSQTLVDLNHLEGVPDGMVLTPDEQSVIVSLYNPNPAGHGETHQYSLFNGELEHVWQTPGSPQNTCPLLIEGSDGKVQLVITTAVEHMPADRRSDSPNAGGLFIASTSFPTAPASPVFGL